MEKPKYPAICIAHTPSGPTYCCAKHAKKIVALFNFMGAHVHIETISDNVECQNCLNEAAKSGPPEEHTCTCDMRTKLVGDGCSVCNPEYYKATLEE